jgi:hypothetical protein
MRTLRALYHLMRADLLERTRRWSFVVTAALTIVAASIFLPPVTAPYRTLAIGDLRGVYTSAWVGAVMAIYGSAVLSLPAFYLIKDTLERDQQTGVGQILATTPLSRPLYTLGKALSNFAVLTALVGIVAVVAGILQLLRGEDLRVDPWALLSPFIIVTLPTMALVAALAVLVETVSWLRGVGGNVCYFALWTGSTLLPLLLPAAGALGGSIMQAVSDPWGVTPLLASMSAALQSADPVHAGPVSIGFIFTARPTHVVAAWQGMQWTREVVLGRLLWIGVAFSLALAAAWFFHRFDPALERPRERSVDRSAGQSAEQSALGRRQVRQQIGSCRAEQMGRMALRSPTPVPTAVTAAAAATTGRPTPPAPPPVRGTTLRARFWATLGAEVRLTLRGARWWWWYGGAAGLIIAGALVPLEIGLQYLLVAAWVWPLPLWSALGGREVRYQTQNLIFSAPHPLRRQLPATWLAGVMVSVAMGSGVLARLMLAASWGHVLAWAAGALFSPTLAVTLGIWSGGPRLFEVVYLLLWYLGPLGHLVYFDYAGVTDAAIAQGMPGMFLVATLGLLGMAVLGRRRQLRQRRRR